MATQVTLSPDGVSIITQIVASSQCAHPLSPEEVKWAVDVVISLMTTDAELMYRNLVLMDRRSWIGRVALVYALRFTQAVHGYDNAALAALWVEAPFPELDDNTGLTSSQRQWVENRLHVEMMKMNHMLVSGRPTDSDFRTQCMREVCLQVTGEDLPFIQGSEAMDIWVPAAGGAQCFRLLDLLYLLIVAKPNPYTGKPFTQGTITYIAQTYPIEIVMVRFYLQMMGLVTA